MLLLGLTLQGLMVNLCITMFNIQKFYVAPREFISVFCTNHKTNSNFFSIQHLMTDFNNRDGQSLLCDTN
jgi:hypothetical protein